MSELEDPRQRKDILLLIRDNMCIGHDVRQGCPYANESHGLYYHCVSCLEIYMRRYDGAS